MKYILIILSLIFLGCSSNSVSNLEVKNLLICDPYISELKNQSRYIKINGIKGNRIESKYLITEQRHIFNVNDTILEINFYHRLIEDQILEEPKIKNQVKELRQVKFGLIEIILKSKKSNNTIDKAKLYKLIESIKIKEFENHNVVLTNREKIKNIPRDLLALGAIKFEKSKERKALTISIQQDSKEEIIQKLYSNIEILYKHLDDNDIIEFQSKDLKEEIVRTYILVNSFGKDLDTSAWCGMGSKIKRFECMYIKNHDL